MSVKVSFVVIGAQKSGTTSLSFQLAQHPEIGLCRHKEPDFFSKSPGTAEDLDDYHQLFSGVQGKVFGEASTTYSWFPEYPDTAHRIAEYNPDMKLIYVMRQPVERIRSHYVYERLKARTKADIDVEVLANPSYVNRSRYGMQLDHYLQRFPRTNLLPLIFEEYIREPHRALAHIADHLDIDPSGFEAIDLRARNRSSDRLADRKIKNMLAPMARILPLTVRNLLRRPFVYKLDQEISLFPQTQRVLWQMLADDVAAVERFLGRQVEAWRADAPPGLLK